MEGLLIKYFHDGYSQKEILNLFLKKHKMKTSISTIKRKLSALNLKKKLVPESNITDIIKAIVNELYLSGNNMGYKSMWNRLKFNYKLVVKRDTVYNIMKIADPEGISQRYGNRLKRRQYINPGPNYCLHTDGYDKLAQFGFYIHGGIDGHSRKIMWLRVANTNKQPRVVAWYFLNTVKKLGYLPNIVRSDKGTENCYIESLQVALRSNHQDKWSGSKSFVIGKSTANQRIESYWGQMRKYTVDFYIQVFKSMHEEHLFDYSDLHIKCLQYCFGPLIIYDLKMTEQEWNKHKIRKKNGRHIITGKPNILYFAPKDGINDYKREVNMDVVENLIHRFTDEPVLIDPLFKELVEILLPNVQVPSTPDEAVNLYKQILLAISRVN